MSSLVFEFVDGTQEVVWPGSPRHRELLADGHAPVGSVPESDGVSDDLAAYLDERIGAGVAAEVEDPESATSAALSATYVARGGHFDGLRAALDSDRSTAIQVLGDSTGNATDEWVYLFAQQIAAANPAHTVRHRLWNDATQAYDAATVIQTGTDGERYADFNGAGTPKGRMLPASQVPHIAGDLDVRVKVRLPAWSAPGGTKTLISRYYGAGQRSWAFELSSTGAFVFRWSADGTTENTHFGSNNGIADGATAWCRVTLDADNGSGSRVVKFYTGTDGVGWTQVGATITTAGVAALFNPPANGAEIGARGMNGGILSTGSRIYEVDVRDGIDGKPTLPRLPDLWQKWDSNSPPMVGAPVLDVVNASHPGATIAYLNDVTRLPKLIPDYGQSVTLLSCSHNEGGTFGRDFLARYDAWVAAVKTRLPLVPVVVLTQNPKDAAAGWASEHGKRRVDLLGYARQAGALPVDIYGAFLDSGQAGLIDVDGTHPTAAGSQVWADTVAEAANL